MVSEHDRGKDPSTELESDYNDSKELAVTRESPTPALFEDRAPIPRIAGSSMSISSLTNHIAANWGRAEEGDTSETVETSGWTNMLSTVPSPPGKGGLDEASDSRPYVIGPEIDLQSCNMSRSANFSCLTEAVTVIRGSARKERPHPSELQNSSIPLTDDAVVDMEEQCFVDEENTFEQNPVGWYLLLFFAFVLFIGAIILVYSFGDFHDLLTGRF